MLPVFGENCMRLIRSQSLAVWLLLVLSILLASCSADDSQGQKLSSQRVRHAVLSADGRFALNITPQNTANLWDLKHHRLRYEWHNNRRPSPLVAGTFSADAKFAATVEAHNIALWEVDTGKTIAYWDIHDAIEQAVLGDTGYYALLGLNTGKIYYVDMFTGKSVRTFQHGSSISALALSIDSRYALSGADDHKAVLWNVQTGETIRTFAHNAPIRMVALSNHNQYALTYASGELKIWQLHTGELVRTLPLTETLVAGQFAVADNYIALATETRKIMVWNINTGEIFAQWQLDNTTHSDPILALAFVEGDEKLIAEDAAGKLYQKTLKLHP
jgi:WD40 repeat protein